MDNAERFNPADQALRARAAAVIPGGMYGHQRVAGLPASYPQFIARSQGALVWDVDGNEYVDLMCSYGPIVLGHHHRAVDAAAAAQQARGDCQNGPAPVMVDLAERLVQRVAHADWALFAKNGTDATTACMTIARAGTGRRRILVAEGAYHGAAPWCTPSPAGVVDGDRAHLDHYTFNDLASVHEAVARGRPSPGGPHADADDLAGIVVSPFRHDARHEQELVDPVFARGLRALCDETGAALIIDEVRAGFRMARGGSWEPLDVAPDLSAWSKAIANGYPLAAVLGNRQFERGARRAYLTGSFWFSAAAMAAGLATIDALETTDALETMVRCGQRLRDGLTDQAATHGIAIAQTGPAQMPLLTFAGDHDFAMADVWAGTAVAAGAYVHPWHNWFLSAAHTDALIDRALDATDQGFAAVASRFGAGTGTDATPSRSDLHGGDDRRDLAQQE